MGITLHETSRKGWFDMHDPSNQHKAVPSLLDVRLKLTQQESGVFVALAPTLYSNRIYGGHLMAQALLAANAYVKGCRPLMSLQAYFLAPGDPQREVGYDVTVLRDGRTTSARAIEVHQGDRLIASCRALYGALDRDDVQFEEPAAEVPPPDTLDPLPRYRQRTKRPVDGINVPPTDRWWQDPRPFDIRYVVDPGDDPKRYYWFRSEETCATSQNEHRALLAYACDNSLASAVSHTRGDLHRGEKWRNASVDHVMWFHEDVRAGDWYLYVQDSPYSTRRTGIALGHIYNLNRQMVATAVQQGIRSQAELPSTAGLQKRH